MASPKIIKLSKEDDLSSAVKHIKNTRDREIIFDVEKGSGILASSDSLKLMKKTGEVMGKKVRVQTMDETGRMLAKKAGVLHGDTEVKVGKSPVRVARSDVKPRFSDIVRPKKPGALPTATAPIVIPKISTPKSVTRTVVTEDGSRLEFEAERSPASKFSKIFILCLVVLVVVVFGLAVLLPKADVTVFARSEPISRDFELTVDKAIAAADRNSLQIPGVPVTKEVSQTKSFPTTGVKSAGTKATGTVVIVNNTANTLKLGATTTTLVAGGKKYFFTRDVSGIKPNGAANTAVPIIAENGGEDYNIAANTRFQIVNAALGNANVYAQNSQALSGGTTGTQTKVLSQADIDQATAALVNAVIAETEAVLTSERAVKMILLPSAAKHEVLAKTANKDVGVEADTFDMTLIARVTGLAFKEDDVTSVVVSKINEVLSSDKYLLDGQLREYESQFKSIDQTQGKGVLAVHFETIAAYKVDDENLPKILAGKNESEIKEILLSKPEIDKVEVKFWPEWFVHKAPKFNGKINISTVLSELN